MAEILSLFAADVIWRRLSNRPSPEKFFSAAWKEGSRLWTVSFFFFGQLRLL